MAVEDSQDRHVTWARTAPHAERIAAAFLVRRRQIDSDARRKDPADVAAPATAVSPPAR